MALSVTGLLLEGVALIHAAHPESHRNMRLLHLQFLPAKETKMLCVKIRRYGLLVFIFRERDWLDFLGGCGLNQPVFQQALGVGARDQKYTHHRRPNYLALRHALHYAKITKYIT